MEEVMPKSVKLSLLKASLSVVAIASVITLSDWSGISQFASSPAFAQSSGSKSGNQGGQGQGSKGSQGGQSNQGSQGTGQAGPGPDSDSKGPQAGGPSSSGSGGGKPVWAQEGIPEVELGRLSVARSPDQVLQRAYDEALAALTPEMVSFYSLDLDQMIYELSTNFDGTSFIDSPLQNLSLLKDALDGTSALTTLGVTNTNDTLLAVFLGTASDKTITVTADTVTAVTTILGTPLTGAAADALAAEAESVRIAILAGHG
jgi:hypothetical protein